MNDSASSSPNPRTPELAQVEEPQSWRPLVVPVIVVIVGLCIAWALFAHYGRSKPDASGQVLRAQVYPVQVDAGNTQQDPGMQGQAEEQDETIVLVQARVTNVSQKPLTIFDMVDDVKVNGDSNQSSAALPDDIEKLFQRFPDLATMRMQPLTRHQVIQPGQSAEGLVVFSFPWNQQQWNQHKGSQLIVSFQNGRSLYLTLD